MLQYSYFRGRPSVTIQYTGSPQLIGRLAVCAVPVREYDASFYEYAAVSQDVQASGPGLIKLLSYPHLIIDACLACTCTLNLDYVLQQPYGLSLSTNDYVLYFAPLGALARADGTTITPLTVSVLVAYDDLDALALVPQGREDDTGLLSSGLRYAASFTQRYQSPFVALLNAGADIAARLGFSRPPADISSQTLPRGVGTMSACSGIADQVQHLGKDPMQMYNVETTHLPGALGTFSSLVTNHSNFFMTELLSAYNLPYNVCPDAIATDGTYYYPNAMNCVAAVHNRWTGDMRVKVTFVSSPLVRTRIGINLLPPGAVFGGSYISNGSVFSMQLDVIGTTECWVDVPWRCPTTSLPCFMSTVTTSSTLFSRLVFYVLDGPVGPSATTPTPGFSLEYYPSTNFEFALQSLYNLNGFFQTQGLLADTYGVEISSFEELAKTSVDCLLVGVNTAVTAPYRNMVGWPVDGVSPARAMSATPGATGRKLTVSNLQWSYHRFAISISLGFTGSSVWRAVVGTSTDGIQFTGLEGLPCLVGEYVDYVQAGSSVQLGSVWPTLNVQSGNNGQYFVNGVAEVLCPDYNLTRYKATTISPNPAVPDALHYVVQWSSMSTASSDLPLVVRAAHSAGDDVRYGMFMPPTWIHRT